MKIFLILSLLVSGIAQARALKCVTDERVHEVRMDLDLDAKKIHQMTYLKNGKVIKEFSDLDIDRFKDIFQPRKVFYEVVFNEGSYYMDLLISPDQVVSGVYIPKSSLFSLERSFVCE